MLSASELDRLAAEADVAAELETVRSMKQSLRQRLGQGCGVTRVRRQCDMV